VKLRVLNQVLLVTFLFIGSLFTVMLFWGSQSVGISTDEHIHMLDLGEWRWTADPDQERHFGVYGLSFQLLGHALAVILGIESLGQISYTPLSFGIRHLVVATLTLFTAIAVFALSRILTRSWVWATWGAVALLAIPPFLGHGFFNTKDIPTAAGYTLFSLSAVLSIYLLRFRRPSWWSVASIIFVGIAGTWLAVGTRLGMLFPFALTSGVLGFSYIAIFYLWKARGVTFFRPYFYFLGGFLSGLVAVAITNPCRVAPVSQECTTGLELLPRIFGISSDYVWSGTTFIAGRQVSGQDPDFWYLPLALTVGVPLIVLILAFVGAVFSLENYEIEGDAANSSALSTTGRGVKYLFAASFFVVMAQATLVPVTVILFRSTLYDLQRQFLFVYPAIAVLATLGLSLIWQKASRPGRARNSRLGLVALVSIIALVVPLAESFRLWPYTYVYVNPVASWPGYQAYWETDYWMVGMREAMAQIPENAQFGVAGAYWLLTPYVLDEIEVGVQRKPTQNGYFVIRSRRAGFGWNDYLPDCEPYSKVERRVRGQYIPIAFVSLCPKEFRDKSWVDTGIHPFEHVIAGP